MSRARDDEWTFVLLGRDAAAAATVEFWIAERVRLKKNEPDDAQIVEARKWVDSVRAEQKARAEDAARERDMRCVVCCRESDCRELYVRPGFRCAAHAGTRVGDPRHDPVTLDAPDAPANPEQGAR